MSQGNKLQKLSIPLDGLGLRHTDKAIQIISVEVWMPRSQIQEFEHDKESDRVSFWAPEWIINEKCIEHFIDTNHEPRLFDI